MDSVLPPAKDQPVLIAADHAGFDLKSVLIQHLHQTHREVQDFGTHSPDSMDYPDVVHPLARSLRDGQRGIVVCGSGNGVSMVANKYPDVRCALAWNVETARLARQHNNANILALPARFLTTDDALAIVEAFLTTDFEGGRHQRRVDKVAPGTPPAA